MTQGFDLSKFRSEFLQSDGWRVSDCYKPYEDKFLRKDAQDAYEGAKWGYESRQVEIDELKWMLKNSNEQADDFCKKSIELQKRIDEAMEILEYNEYVDSALQALSILKGTDQC